MYEVPFRTIPEDRAVDEDDSSIRESDVEVIRVPTENASECYPGLPSS